MIGKSNGQILEQKIPEKQRAKRFLKAKAESKAVESKSDLQSQNAMFRSASQWRKHKNNGFVPYTNA